MTYEVTRQSDKILPAEDGGVLVITVDATSRSYDLSLVALGTTWGAGHDGQAFFYVTMSADGGAVYYTFSSTAKTVDDTAALAAGGTVAGFTANGCDVIFSGTKEQVYIWRQGDKFLNIKTASGGAKLRIHVSSDLTTGASA